MDDMHPELKMDGLPKASAPKKGSKAWKQQEFHRFVELTKTDGPLISPSAAAVFLGVSRQRVYQLMDLKILPTWEIAGNTVVSGRVIIERLENPPTAGRPPGILQAA